jgi:excisionase family DNA binding protein
MMNILSDSGSVLTVKEVAHFLKTHPSTIYRLLKARQLPAFRVGSDWRLNREDIDRWRMEREKQSRGIQTRRDSFAPKGSLLPLP